jgi:hypothetical protein
MRVSRFFTAVMFQVEVFWFVTPCSVVVEYSVSGVHAASFFRVKLLGWEEKWDRYRFRLESDGNRNTQFSLPIG